MNTTVYTKDNHIQAKKKKTKQNKTMEAHN